MGMVRAQPWEEHELDAPCILHMDTHYPVSSVGLTLMQIFMLNAAGAPGAVDMSKMTLSWSPLSV